MSSTKPTVVVAGTFDLFHRGHLSLLTRAAGLGEVHALVNTDMFVTAFKGRLPIQHQDDRLAMVRAQRPVLAASLNHSADLRTTIDRYVPQRRGLIVVVGDDYNGESYYKQTQIDQSWLDQYNGLLVFLPRVGNWSTTALIEKIKRERA